MVQRVTAKDLKAYVAGLADSLIHLGLMDEGIKGRIVIEPGAKQYGRAWRLFVTDENGGLHNHFGLEGWPAGGYLGMTASEALATLEAFHAGARFAVQQLRAAGRLTD